MTPVFHSWNPASRLLREKEEIAANAAPAVSARSIFGNSFNPSIGMVMNGRASTFSGSTSEITGFGVGEEGERGSEGLSLGESELTFSVDVGNKF